MLGHGDECNGERREEWSGPITHHAPPVDLFAEIEIFDAAEDASADIGEVGTDALVVAGEEGVGDGFVGFHVGFIVEELGDDVIALSPNGIGGFDALLRFFVIGFLEGVADIGEEAIHFGLDGGEGIVVMVLGEVFLVELSDFKDIFAVVSDAFGVLGDAHEGEAGGDILAGIDSEVADHFASETPEEFVDGLIAGVY